MGGVNFFLRGGGPPWVFGKKASGLPKGEDLGAHGLKWESFWGEGKIGGH